MMLFHLYKGGIVVKAWDQAANADFLEVPL